MSVLGAKMKHIGNLEITKSNQDDFKDLTEVSGDLYVYGQASLQADALTTIGGGLYVHSPASLQADALTTIGGNLYVYGQASLQADALTTIGGDLYVNSQASLQADALTTIGGDLYVNSPASLNAPKLDRNKKITRKQLARHFEKKGFVFADGILQKKISKKQVGSLTIYKTKKLASDESGYVVFDGENYSHGKTIKQAKDDLIFKLTSRDTSEFKKWKVTDKKPIKDLVMAYRSITGACEFGVKQFVSQNVKKTKYSVKEVIELTKGQYGSDKFKGFFND